MNDAVIEVRDLAFRYQQHLPPVLTDINLRIESGDFVALLGQNGAGKTTLAKHFNGLLRPTAGTVQVHGRDTRRQKLADLAKNVGYCYQNPDHQIFSSTVEKEVRFGPSNLGLRAEQLDNAVEEALELVGLQDRRDAYPFSLGRGQRQLLAVASVLAMGASTLVVDEPTTGMDHEGATRIMELLAKWSAAGRTIIVITHDMAMVAEHIPRSVVMAGGRLVAEGPTKTVLCDQDALRQAHLLAPPAVWMSSQLASFGLPICGSIAELSDAVVERVRRGHASRI